MSGDFHLISILGIGGVGGRVYGVPDVTLGWREYLRGTGTQWWVPRGRRYSTKGSDRSGSGSLPPRRRQNPSLPLPVYAAPAPETAELQSLQPIPAQPRRAVTRRSCIIHETTSFLGHPEALVSVLYNRCPTHRPIRRASWRKGGANRRLGTPLFWLFRGLSAPPSVTAGEEPRPWAERPGGREGR